MEITTKSNLIGLALELSNKTFESPADLTEKEFGELIDAVYEKLAPQLIENCEEVNQTEEEDEVLSFHLGTY